MVIIGACELTGRCARKNIIGCGPVPRATQTVGYIRWIVNRVMPHPTPPTHPPKSTTLDSRWAAQQGLGPNAVFCIATAVTFTPNKHWITLQGCDRRKQLPSAPKLLQFKGAAAKTGVPPEGHIILLLY